jgi:putative acetyltransferase
MAGRVRIRAYQAGDASAIVRLFYETVHSVNQANYSEEQLEAWAPVVPDQQVWHRACPSPAAGLW